MEFLKADHFAQKHGGLDGLLNFISLCNKETDLDVIADHFGISSSQVSRLRSGLCNNVWMPKKGTMEFIEFLNEAHQRKISDKQKSIDEKIASHKNSELQLIQCGPANGQNNK